MRKRYAFLVMAFLACLFIPPFLYYFSLPIIRFTGCEVCGDQRTRRNETVVQAADFFEVLMKGRGTRRSVAMGVFAKVWGGKVGGKVRRMLDKARRMLDKASRFACKHGLAISGWPSTS